MEEFLNSPNFFVTAMSKLAPTVPMISNLKTQGTITLRNECQNHAEELQFWCQTCCLTVCLLCPFQSQLHSGHVLVSKADRGLQSTKAEQELNECIRTLERMELMQEQQKDFYYEALDSCLKVLCFIEEAITSSSKVAIECRKDQDSLLFIQGDLEGQSGRRDMKSPTFDVTKEKKKLEERVQDLAARLQLQDLITKVPIVLDPRCKFVTPPPPVNGKPHPLVFLTNFCVYQLTVQSPIVYNPSVSFPRFYFVVHIEDRAVGQFVVETRTDVAPNMSANFAALCKNVIDPNYRNCSIFQCWEESIITGDNEHNNGKGGRSALYGGSFFPDLTPLEATRGAVGMRRTRASTGSPSMVASQFRIMLRSVTTFSGIFGHVVDGLPLIEIISTLGRGGRPTQKITIGDCGAL